MPLALCLYSTPSIKWYILNLRAIRSIYASLSASGRFSKYDLIWLIQSNPDCWSGPSMTMRPVSSDGSIALTEGLTSLLRITSGGVGAPEEAIHAKWSASRLSSRGTYLTLKPSKNFSSLRTSARYSVILSLLQSYSFYTCFATNWESPRIRSHRMSRSLASRSPVTSPSYIVILFVAGNPSWIAHFKMSPSGGISTTPAPAPFKVYDPSKYITQWSGNSSMPRKPESVHSAMKSASA
jgi:hypothetical protein